MADFTYDPVIGATPAPQLGYDPGTRRWMPSSEAPRFSYDPASGWSRSGASAAGADAEVMPESVPWYERPDFDFSAVKPYGAGPAVTPLPGVDPREAAVGQLPIPEDFRQLGLTDPRNFYEVYQRNFADNPAAVANVASAAEAQRKDEAAQQAAIDRLQSSYDLLKSEYGAFQADSLRDTIRDELLRRTSPEYSVVSPEEQAALELQLAQAAGRAIRQQQRSAAARGVGGGGAAIEREAALRAIASAGGVQLRGRLAAADEQARERALGALTQFSETEARLDQAYLGALTAVQGNIASIEADEMNVPTDFLAFDHLTWSREQYERERADRIAQQGSYEAALEVDLFDWLTMGLDFLAAGGANIAANVFG